MRLSATLGLPARAVRWAAVVGMSGVPAIASGQANLSTQGFGYPTGEVTTASMATGGALGEFDPASAINPAALGVWGRAGIHFQFSPEFRSVTSPQGTDHTTTMRFPLLSAGVPVGGHFVVGLSLATFLDRSWETRQVEQLPIGDTTVSTGETFRSTGGIEDVRLAGAWSPAGWLRIGLGLHAFTGRNQITVGRDFPDTTTVKTLPFTDTSTYSFNGIGVSTGVQLHPTRNFEVAASLRVGGGLRVSRRDTLQSKGNVPPRAGASIRYDGLTGVSLAIRGDWEGWSRMEGLGSPDLHPADAWEYSAGADIVGPKMGERAVLLRLGGRTRTLPFRADGAIVHEHAFSGGFGIPFPLERAVFDIALERAIRSAPVGVSEGAWTLSAGLTVRP